MAVDPYATLFGAYMVELRAARSQALEWWDALIERELTPDSGDKSEAEQAVRLRWPMGPTAFPRVIAVYRKYYLAIHQVNTCLMEEDERDTGDDDPLDDTAWCDAADDDETTIQHPRTVLYEQLDSVDKELARFMDRLLFVPIGADELGHLL